ncbi:MAG: methyltransferase domain-containing protein [Crocinitomix sp.]|nr:methyltransferase domain-containing protein [Crocinitomix sp.]
MEKEFWDKRWKKKTTGWDMGQVSPPIQAYIDQLIDKSIRVLIPGCGNAYEAQYLMEQGFKNTFIVEISQGAIDSFKARYPEFPEDQIFHQDFFELETTHPFDLILEQTFFCAIQPEKRNEYAVKMKALLKPKGKLVGLMFDFPLESGPPFGGSVKEYETYFLPQFTTVKMDRAHNSIEPRQGRELFVMICSD